MGAVASLLAAGALNQNLLHEGENQPSRGGGQTTSASDFQSQENQGRRRIADGATAPRFVGQPPGPSLMM